MNDFCIGLHLPTHAHIDSGHFQFRIRHSMYTILPIFVFRAMFHSVIYAIYSDFAKSLCFSAGSFFLQRYYRAQI